MPRQKKLKTEEIAEDNSSSEKSKEKSEINIEKEILELAKQGITSEKIGLILKQNHNIRNVKKETGKKISQILKENNLYTDPEVINLKKKVEKLNKHLSKNKHDYTTKRISPIKAAKIRKLEKYRKA